MSKIKKESGYTLIELLLYIGIVAVLGITVFSFYTKKQEETKINNLTRVFQEIDVNVNNSLAAIISYSGLNNGFLTSSKLVPNEMIVNNNTISNTLGGTLDISPFTVNGNPGYALSANFLSPSVCTKLATTKYASDVQQVLVNDTIVKAANTALTPQAIALIAQKCTENNNTVMFRNAPNSAFLDGNGLGENRVKEQPQYISTVGTPSASGLSSSCAGGTTWNGSFCSCPTGTEWNGGSCVAFNTVNQPGWCPRGSGWLPGTKTCAVLPNGSSSNQYVAGKNLPNVIDTPVTDTLRQGMTIPTTRTEVITGRNIVSPNGNIDDNPTQATVQVCINGSWNPTANRCVTN